MNTKFTAGLLGATMAATGVATLAYGAEGAVGERIMKHKGPQVSEEVRESLKSAFETNDYTAYATLAKENEFNRVATEEQFEEKIARFEAKQEAKEAVLENDYAAWRTVVGDERATDITESNFDLLVSLAQARESEDEEAVVAAKKALKEAGLKKPGKKGKRASKVKASNLYENR